MSPYLSHKRSGAPTYTEISASLSLSGLEDFSPLDPNPLDAAEWYQHPGSEHHHSYDFPPLSPGHDHFATTGFGPGGFASHGITVTSAEMHRKPFSPLSVVHVSPSVSPFCPRSATSLSRFYIFLRALFRFHLVCPVILRVSCPSRPAWGPVYAKPRFRCRHDASSRAIAYESTQLARDFCHQLPTPHFHQAPPLWPPSPTPRLHSSLHVNNILMRVHPLMLPRTPIPRVDTYERQSPSSTPRP
jgi:hypothetical protein